MGKMWKLVWKWDRLINWTESRKQGQTNKPDREPETGTDQQAGQRAGNRDRPTSRTESRKQGQTNKLDSVSE